MWHSLVYLDCILSKRHPSPLNKSGYVFSVSGSAASWSMAMYLKRWGCNCVCVVDYSLLRLHTGIGRVGMTFKSVFNRHWRTYKFGVRGSMLVTKRGKLNRNKTTNKPRRKSERNLRSPPPQPSHSPLCLHTIIFLPSSFLKNRLIVG